MTEPLYLYRTRLGFPGQSRSLIETGRTMERFAEMTLELLAPELVWTGTVQEHADYGSPDAWEASHVVHYEGRSSDGSKLGQAESVLRSGGRGARLGGNAQIQLETIRPIRHLTITTPCDVSTWDLAGGPLDDKQIDGLRRILETLLGAGSNAAGERRSPLATLPLELLRTSASDDAALWLRDLRDAGITGRAVEDGEEICLMLDHASLSDLDGLYAARVTLGEILAEVGRGDWSEAALHALIALRR